MDKYERIYFQFLKYVVFIRDEKVKPQRFLIGLCKF
jgi:hypothetical protein